MVVIVVSVVALFLALTVRWAWLSYQVREYTRSAEETVAVVLRLPRESVQVWAAVPFFTPWVVTYGVRVNGKPDADAEQLLKSIHAAVERLSAIHPK